MIHLDTSFLVDLLREARRRQPAAAMAKLEELADEDLGISIFALCELEAGAACSKAPDEERRRMQGIVAPLAIAPVDAELAEHYGRLLADLRTRGLTISTMDLLIAASALADGAPLVTRNRRHFERVQGLRIIHY